MIYIFPFCTALKPSFCTNAHTKDELMQFTMLSSLFNNVNMFLINLPQKSNVFFIFANRLPRKQKRADSAPLLPLKQIIILNMLHDLPDIAVQNIAKPVDGVFLHIAVVSQPIDLRTIYIMVRIKIILRNASFFHGCPQLIIYNHFSPVILILILTILSMAIK